MYCVGLVCMHEHACRNCRCRAAHDVHGHGMGTERLVAHRRAPQAAVAPRHRLHWPANARLYQVRLMCAACSATHLMSCQLTCNPLQSSMHLSAFHDHSNAIRILLLLLLFLHLLCEHALSAQQPRRVVQLGPFPWTAHDRGMVRPTSGASGTTGHHFTRLKCLSCANDKHFTWLKCVSLAPGTSQH
jgi:hypothetical protein